MASKAAELANRRPQGRPSNRWAGRQRMTRKLLGALTFSSLIGATIIAPTADATSRPVVLFQQFSTCPRLLGALREMSLPNVGPNGLVNPELGVPAPPPRPTPQPTPRPTGRKTPKQKVTKAPAGSPAPTPATFPAGPATTAAPAAAPATAAPAIAAAPASPAVSPDAPQNTKAAPATDGAVSNSSATNVQEFGVDEGDTVENDGRYLFSTVRGALRIIDTTSGTTVATLQSMTGQEQLLLDKNKLAVVRPVFGGFPETAIDLWDVTDRAKPRKLSESHLEGTAIAVRSVGGRARIVLETQFAQRLQFVQPLNYSAEAYNAAQRANENVVRTAPVEDWLPRSYIVRADGSQTAVRSAIDCREVGRPAQFSGLGFTWVATLDLDIPNARERAIGSAGVIADGQIVYSSTTNLYVATNSYNKVLTRSGTVQTNPKAFITAIHKFDLSPPDGATYRASGQINGKLLNQFSMSELNGDLRVAATLENAGFGTTTASSVYVLRQNAPRALNVVGQVDGLGRTERIYAVRFVGDLGYVVTFRRTDPLFVIDLRQPEAPRVVGELIIPGYSSYLQPIGPGRLIGIGEDATANGQVTGMQLSLFDVSDPSSPKQLAKLKVGGSSVAEYDHHAFLYWGATKNVIVPSMTYGPEGPKGGVIVATVDDSGIVEKGRVVHEQLYPFNNPPIVTPNGVFAPPADIVAPTPIPPLRYQDEPITRSLIVDGKLVTVSANGVKGSNLSTLETNWFLKNP
jgi:Beta propeller domain